MRRASRISRSSSLLLFSQKKVSKTVADISVSGTKLHVSYSDGTSKDIDISSTSSGNQWIINKSEFPHGPVTYVWMYNKGQYGNFKIGVKYLDGHVDYVIRQFDD